ncbi:hypothetical protein [Maribacter sp.]|uniref:hypothetical protein n=1 Tax=Maribacter sp. TaxID=1897614 RepID=UPI003298D6D1
MKKLVVFISILFLVSCNGQKSEIEIIDFENPYKFSSQIESEVEKDTTSWKYQMSSQAYAMKGDYWNALKHWDLAMGTWEDELTEQQIDSINGLYKTENAVDFIIEQAKLNQVVIINEAHHSSLHRVLTKSLLQDLYKIGYKNIGFETLGNGEYTDSLLMQRKYPIQETGYYTKDPQFGDLIRTALQIGFHVFPYEQTNDSNGKPREIEQAKNIQNEIEKKPNEKFLIHCGFNHAFEGIHETWEKAMAARLTEYTGINPLTIDQIRFSEKSMPVFNHPILKAFEVNEPSVLIDKNGNPMKVEKKERWTDLAVVHPKTKLVYNRPNWLFRNGNKPVTLELNNLDISFPVMVLAYKKGEDIKTGVPTDILEVENKTDIIKLALKKGAYEIVVTNLDGNSRKIKLYAE